MSETRREYQPPTLAVDPPRLYTPHIVLIGGSPGSGKSTLLESINADYAKGKANFVGLDVDEFRRQSLSHAKDAQLREAHEHLLLHVLRLASEGCAVAIISTFKRKPYREQKRRFAGMLRVGVLSYALEIPQDEQIKRVLARDDSTSSDIRTLDALTLAMEGTDPYDDMTTLNGMEHPNKLKMQILKDQINAGFVSVRF